MNVRAALNEAKSRMWLESRGLARPDVENRFYNRFNENLSLKNSDFFQKVTALLANDMTQSQRRTGTLIERNSDRPPYLTALVLEVNFIFTVHFL